MKIILERPIVFVDLESTGTEPDKDRIVQIATVKLFPDESRESKMYYVNPEIPIPPAATAIHGITDEMVADKKPFRGLLASRLHEYIVGCDMGGFKSNTFDIPMLFYEFDRAGIVWDYKQSQLIDVGNIYHIRERRTLEAAFNFYCGKSLEENAHDATHDINATIDVLEGQIEMYQDLPRTVKELAFYSNYEKEWLDLQGKFIVGPQGEVVLNFGKKKGEPAKQHPGFLEWILREDFPADVKLIAQKLLTAINTRP